MVYLKFRPPTPHKSLAGCAFPADGSLGAGPVTVHGFVNPVLDEDKRQLACQSLDVFVRCYEVENRGAANQSKATSFVFDANSSLPIQEQRRTLCPVPGKKTLVYEAGGLVWHAVHEFENLGGGPAIPFSIVIPESCTAPPSLSTKPVKVVWYLEAIMRHKSLMMQGDHITTAMPLSMIRAGPHPKAQKLPAPPEWSQVVSLKSTLFKKLKAKESSVDSLTVSAKLGSAVVSEGKPLSLVIENSENWSVKAVQASFFRTVWMRRDSGSRPSSSHSARSADYSSSEVDDSGDASGAYDPSQPRSRSFINRLFSSRGSPVNDEELGVDAVWAAITSSQRSAGPYSLIDSKRVASVVGRGSQPTLVAPSFDGESCELHFGAIVYSISLRVGFDTPGGPRTVDFDLRPLQVAPPAPSSAVGRQRHPPPFMSIGDLATLDFASPQPSLAGDVLHEAESVDSR